MILPLKRYAQFAGRSQRQEIWWYFVGYILLWVVILAAIAAVGLSASGRMPYAVSSISGIDLGAVILSLSTFGLVLFFLWLGLLLPTLAVQVRRLHDLDRSGWWIMLSWGPYLLSFLVGTLGAISQSGLLILIGSYLSGLSWLLFAVLLVIYFLPGIKGENDYGLDPKGGGADLANTFQ
ncbi:DUF805 domain-containing protein [Sphingomonas sp.]|uniref:DUF805 domain-containing protein n=1 Tax=Sphingomonas sp. TaxID=28214 RepID=UPI0025EABBE8|nr:DUF805 domain-containing protein [Sphingomonas sp.]